MAMCKKNFPAHMQNNKSHIQCYQILIKGLIVLPGFLGVLLVFIVASIEHRLTFAHNMKNYMKQTQLAIYD